VILKIRTQLPLEHETPTIDPIRVEMLSTELPVHQLSKKGDLEIRIIRRAESRGQATLYWKVEPNLALGRPGQLAYHLDTWVINRRIDQLPRPIPRLIRVGDLRQIARELGYGGDTSSVKRAFEQNASAFIRAKVAYVRKDGVTATLEGYFNRYNVIYRGQTLPGGVGAETVYIALNDPYYDLVNNSRRRPLDYGYLRSLTPGAQRLYELLSPRMFAAIKNGHPSAWIRYSEFCTLAVARRQDTRRRMQTQMAAVHRPHLQSGYFESVSWRVERTSDGTADWTIHYVPGARARAEFSAFNGTRPPVPAVTSVREWSTNRVHRPKRVSSGRVATLSEDEPANRLALLFAERRHGTTEPIVTSHQVSKAAQILGALDGDVDTAIAAVELAAEEGRRDLHGFPRHIGGVLEGGFIDRARAIREEERRRADAATARQQVETERARYREWSDERASRRVARLSESERIQLIDERLPRFVEESRFYIRHRGIGGEDIRAWAEPRLLRRFGHEGEPSFEEWRSAHGAQPTSASGPDEALQ
jgi:hypothetical protein